MLSFALHCHGSLHVLLWQRFLPSEFGNDVDRADPVEPGRRVYEDKRKVRRAVEAAGIPYTYICCNSIAGWPYHDLHRPSEATPPLDCLPIYGDGNVKGTSFRLGRRQTYVDRLACLRSSQSESFRPSLNFLLLLIPSAYFVAGCDIGKFTVMAAHDPCAVNKAVHFRPRCNFLTMNELASLWEKKIGRALPRVTITEEELLAMAAGQ